MQTIEVPPMSEVRPTIYIAHDDDEDGMLGAAVILSFDELVTSNLYNISAKTAPDRRTFPFDIEKMTSEDHVFVVDLTFPIELLEKVKQRVKSLTVFDHHVSAQEEYRNKNYIYFGDANRCSAKLAYEYYNEEGYYPECPVVELINTFDTWNQNHPDYDWTMVCQYVSGALKHRSSLSFWMEEIKKFALSAYVVSQGIKLMEEMKSFVDKIHGDSRYSTIFQINPLTYNKQRGLILDFEHCGQFHHSILLESLRVMDRSSLNSESPLKPLVFDLLLYVKRLNLQQIKIGIRSYNVKEGQFSALDVAKRFPTGGGHLNAAGFTLILTGSEVTPIEYVEQMLRATFFKEQFESCPF